MVARSVALAAMRLLIVDDHALVRAGLRMLVAETRPDAVVDEAATLVEATSIIASFGPTLILLDLTLPDAAGLESLKRVRELASETPILIISGDFSPALIDSAFAGGARGFLPKNSSARALAVALDTVARGELYVPPHVLPSHGTPSEPPPARPFDWPHATPVVRLTSRQTDVLRLLAAGDVNKEIAEKLDMSGSTVRVHVSAILRALGVENRTQAATHPGTRVLLEAPDLD